MQIIGGTPVPPSYSYGPDTSFILAILERRLSENPEYAEMRHGDVILTLNDVTDRRTASVLLFLSFLRAGTGM